ncbi:FMN reductase [Actinotalea sp. C106]|uniref:FMN reductase n=1 Tax=Actinotalea sp. C106 TaxID=2908644 RepID=UPI002027C323|nr:FMN reductase [Actinotalea sp. C106]
MTGIDEPVRRRIAVVSAGLRNPSSTRLLADRLGDAVGRELGERGAVPSVELVELRDHAHDLTNMLHTGFASPELQVALDAVQAADGLVAVTPIYSGTFTGLFKNFVDVLPEGALAGHPVLLGATAGTARHSLAVDHALRPLFAYLRAVVVPTGVFAATDDFGHSQGVRQDDHVAPLADRVDRAARELTEVVLSSSRQRAADPFDDPTPFEQMLRGGPIR